MTYKRRRMLLAELAKLTDDNNALRAEVKHYYKKAHGCEREMNRLRKLLHHYGHPLSPPPETATVGTCGSPYPHEPHPVCRLGDHAGDFTCDGQWPRP